MSPGTGLYNRPVFLTLHHDDSYAWIYYTTDGTDPAVQGRSYYGGKINLENQTTVRAVAKKSQIVSEEVSAEYLFSFRVAYMGDLPEILSDARDAGELLPGSGILLRQNFRSVFGSDIYLSRIEIPEGGEVFYSISEFQEGEFGVLDGQGTLISNFTNKDPFAETVPGGTVRHVLAVQGSRYYIGPNARFEISAFLKNNDI